MGHRSEAGEGSGKVEVRTHFSELMPPDLLTQMVEEKLINQRPHPIYPYTIYNYSKTAQRVGKDSWNAALNNCRGLILDSEGMVIARPFPKFWNLTQHTDAEIPQLPFRALEKMDGSLGICYTDPSGVYPAIATRGSFESDQAMNATQILRQKYPDWSPIPGFTFLFEIIYPSNRIVVDYGETEDLVLLDVVRISDGRSFLRTEDGFNELVWDGPIVNEYKGFSTLADLLAAPEEKEREGYVLRFDNGFRVKVKFEEYTRLHALLTGVSTKTIWDILRIGGSLDEVTDRVPGEFTDWVNSTRRALELARSQLECAAIATNTEARIKMDEELGPEIWYADPAEQKKQFALALGNNPLKSFAFLLWDENLEKLDKALWQKIKPEYARPFVNDEDS